MSLPVFDMDQATWDNFKHFNIMRTGQHYSRMKIYQFVTGELSMRGSPRPHQCKKYPELGIAIASTTNMLGYKFLSVSADGSVKPLAPAQLSHGGIQYFVIHLKSGRVVQLCTRGVLPNNELLPQYLRYASAVLFPEILRKDATVGLLGSPVVAYPPVKLTKEQKQWIAEVRAIAQATLALARSDGRATPGVWRYTKELVTSKGMEMEPTEFLTAVCTGWEDGKLNSARIRIADYGIAVTREPVQHEHVIAK